MGPYVAHVESVPKIMDFADMDSRKWLDYSREKRFPASLGYALEARKLERQEIALARAFDFCTTISVNELETLQGYGTGARADWFPNGVDLDYFTPSPDGPDADLVVFVGRMDYYPNEQAMRWFCNAVWPALRARCDTLRLRIIGANPPRSVRRLTRIRGVEVTGFVEDVRPHVARATVSVAPLRIARGMQNKVLECMAMGVPVVASPRVAHGLGLDAAAPLSIADTAEEYVGAISSVIENPAAQARLSSASRALVEARFSWSRALEQLDSIIESLVGGGPDAHHRPAAAGASGRGGAHEVSNEA
jgi:hypothetical protein